MPSARPSLLLRSRGSRGSRCSGEENGQGMGTVWESMSDEYSGSFHTRHVFMIWHFDFCGVWSVKINRAKACSQMFKAETSKSQVHDVRQCISFLYDDRTLDDSSGTSLPRSGRSHRHAIPYNGAGLFRVLRTSSEGMRCLFTFS